jgi:Transposase DDE domain
MNVRQASRAIRQAEMGAARTMIDRTEERFGLKPERLVGTAYGSAPTLNWLVNDDVARALAKTEAFEKSCRERKRVEMLFAHLKRILRLGRLRLRGPRGAHFEFTLAAIAQNLRRLARLAARPPPAVAACGA